MTGPQGRPLRLQLRRADAGTLLGALAWVLGALQIMRDRGHADDDEAFHERYDRLAPHIERLVAQLNEARRETVTTPAFEDEIKAAYSEVREAFEAWIRLTAVDTLSAAVAQRLGGAERDDTAEAGASPPA